MVVSVIIPARNEEILLPRAIEAIRRSAASREISYEIIVVLNRCTDGTEALALREGCRIVREDAKNLAVIRNAGAREARGEVLIFIDADSVMSTRLIPQAVAELTLPSNVGGGVMMYPERWSLGILCTGLLLLPIALYHGISGGCFWCRRADFEAIEGFNPSLLSAEDIDFARRLKAHAKASGRRFKTLFSAYIVTSCRKFDRFGDWYFLRNPLVTLRLLRGRDRRYADIVWYEFSRGERTESDS